VTGLECILAAFDGSPADSLPLMAILGEPVSFSYRGYLTDQRS
jgi:hypothetical protein